MYREAAACREVGHSVASYVLRRGFRQLTIDPAQESLSEALHGLPEAGWIEIPLHLRRISFVEGNSLFLRATPETERRPASVVVMPDR